MLRYRERELLVPNVGKLPVSVLGVKVDSFVFGRQRSGLQPA